MVVLKLQGGVGNQLFQYAAYFRLRERFSDCYFDVGEFNFPYDNKLRKFSLKYFNTIDLKFVMFNDRKRKWLKFKILYPNIKIFKTPIKKSLKYVSPDEAKCFSFDLSEVTDGMYIEGYFCNEEFQNSLFRRFTYFNVNFLKNSSMVNLFYKIDSCNSCSIHIRRTDYLADKDYNQYSGICTDEYYEKSIAYIKNIFSDSVFYFFSDDISWCEEHFGKHDNFVYVSSNLMKYQNQDVEELFLMSSCKNNIIANSTFSWWGGMLNRNKNKIIVRPPRFDNKNTSDSIFPIDWVNVMCEN